MRAETLTLNPDDVFHFRADSQGRKILSLIESCYGGSELSSQQQGIWDSFWEADSADFVLTEVQGLHGGKSVCVHPKLCVFVCGVVCGRYMTFIDLFMRIPESSINIS